MLLSAFGWFWGVVLDFFNFLIDFEWILTGFWEGFGGFWEGLNKIFRIFFAFLSKIAPSHMCKEGRRYVRSTGNFRIFVEFFSKFLAGGAKTPQTPP